MSKWCLLHDNPVQGITKLDGTTEVWGGCRIYGVWHKCAECPNCREMGDGSYSCDKV